MVFGKMIDPGTGQHPGPKARTRTVQTVASIALGFLLMGCIAEDTGSDDGDNQNLGTVLPVETPEPSTGFGSLPAYSLSDPTFEADHFSGSGACGVCHNDLIDDEGNDVSLEDAWETSTMANSARDPYWRAKAAATLKNHPKLQEKVDDTCTRCHAPMANEAARKDQVAFNFISEGFKSTNPYYDHAMDGVSCTLCHQIEDTGILGTEQSNSGNFSVATFSEEEKENRPAYGPYTDPVGAYMIANSDFSPKYGAHMSDSAMCAVCHDLKTPKLDENGDIIPNTIENQFQEQQTYTEWLNSDYRDGGASAASCQDCHMPEINTTVTLASSGTDIRRQNFSQHTFLGANTVMLDMFENFKSELGITAEGFPAAIERNREFLKTSADLEIVGVRNEGESMITTLKITNHTGHKLPSGYPSRRVYVHFVITDANGAVVFESGKMNADGSIVGVDGDRNYNLYEPHYNSISDESQVLVYEAIMANSAGDVTHSLVEGIRYHKDNRLTPKGFDKTLVDNDVAVVGKAAQDGNFNAGLDLFEYSVKLPAGEYYVLAELVYQPLAFGHLEFLFKDTDLPEVDQFKTIYDATTLKSEVISSAFTNHTK
jgi:hypothetical protein